MIINAREKSEPRWLIKEFLADFLPRNLRKTGIFIKNEEKGGLTGFLRLTTCRHRIYPSPSEIRDSTLNIKVNFLPTLDFLEKLSQQDFGAVRFELFLKFYTSPSLGEFYINLFGAIPAGLKMRVALSQFEWHFLLIKRSFLLYLQFVVKCTLEVQETFFFQRAVVYKGWD